MEEVVEQNIGGKYVSVRSVEEDGEEDVYCMTMPKNGNFVANGIVVKNCDALRYAIFTHLFGRSGGPEGPMTPETLDRLFMEAMDQGQSIPKPFQQPDNIGGSNNFFGGGFF